MEYTEIQKLIDSMGESKLTYLDIEFTDGTKISMKKKFSCTSNSTTIMPNTEVTTTIVSNATLDTTNSSTSSIITANVVKAPMVGTFYSKSNPTSNAFVLEGDKVVKGQTLCIIEAMKLMNEIEAEASGQITEICVKNGESVEFGQVLMYVE